MPGITSCPYTLARKSNVTRAQIDKAINWRKCIASGCDWAPVGELPKVNSTPIPKIPFIADWAVGKVHVKAPETAYTSPFAPTGK